MTTSPADDARRLAAVLSSLERVVVAFSGGVDSSVLAHEALLVLGADRVQARTAASPSLAEGELAHCGRLAQRWGLPWAAVSTDELLDPRYVSNGPDRCAWCKHALMDAVVPVARAQSAAVVLGVNLDDLDDHRPGQAAAAQRGARFPLVEAGLTKDRIRAVARWRGLEVWDRPAMPCLASRVPYGTAVTVEVLGRIDRAETAVRALGYSDIRVRHHGEHARVEVARAQLPDALERAEQLERAVRDAGYRGVVVEPDGLRSGRLNDALHAEQRAPR